MIVEIQKIATETLKHWRFFLWFCASVAKNNCHRFTDYIFYPLLS